MSKDEEGSDYNKKIKYVMKSQFGFNFSATAEMYYEEDYAGECGGMDTGYKRKYSTDYAEKIHNYLQEEITSVEDEYKSYITTETIQTGYYGYEYVYYYHFTISSYNELSKLNDFAYKMYNIYDSKGIKMTPGTFRVYISSNVTSEILMDEVLKNKKNHLKELQYKYINLVQLKKIEDSTIPNTNTISIKNIYVNDKKIEINNDVNIALYQWKYNTYVMPYYNFEYIKINYDLSVKEIYDNKYEYYKDSYYKFSKSLLSEIVDELGGTRKIKDNLEENTRNYTIGKDKYQVIYDKKLRKYTYKKNNIKLDIKEAEPPLYYYFNLRTIGIYKGEWHTIKIEDFAKLINCRYRIDGDKIYFYSY